LFVTASNQAGKSAVEKAIETAENLKLPYFKRDKQSLIEMRKIHNSGCLVITNDRIELFEKETIYPFFFHPNSANFRVKRVMNGEKDPFIESCGLEEGMSFLDCTFGLGSDSIVASYVVGDKGIVTGLERQTFVAYIVQDGLRNWKSEIDGMSSAMKLIELKNKDNLSFLKSLPDRSYDCIYFDPMFEKTVDRSDGIDPLKSWAHHEELLLESLEEAKRVAKHRVVLKDHFQSSRFSLLPFNVTKRKSALFHFGVIEL
jgi:hypothetical protein